MKIILKEVPGKNKMLVLLWIIESKMLVIRRCIVILNTTKEEKKILSVIPEHIPFLSCELFLHIERDFGEVASGRFFS